ncbi:MAG TPA: ABC transporter substrate-binding protein, partial [Dehalococcoidia bacterium]|nr:ABC transporter substrate-binding protein [Dehalococcoidia bacterium]
MESDNYWKRVARRRASRRTVLRASAVGASGAAAYAAVGCGDDDDDDDDGGGTTTTGGGTADTSQLDPQFQNARYGGILQYGINDPPQTLDFHTQEPPGSHYCAHPAYNGLIYRIEDEPGHFSELRGELAETWEQPDEQTIVLNIRQGVKWQNVDPMGGRDFTAENVVYNIERMRGEHPAGN